MKLYLESLGCAKNQVDSEMILGALRQDFKITNDSSLADLIIINTCAFIDAAKEEAINKILELSDYKKKGAKLVVCGCLAKRYKDKLITLLPEVDRFISIDEYGSFSLIINSLINSNFDIKDFSFLDRIVLTPNYMRYIRIADGCYNRCAFCAIPLIRGNLVSRRIEDIKEEVKKALAEGVYEINLISQDTTMYGKDLYKKLAITDLLKELDSLEGDFKIRLLYLYPDILTDELIDFIKNSKHVMPYFDVPIQHSEDVVLKNMNRRGNKEFLINLFKKIKKEIPKATLRTTFIVGFPGETEEEFNGLCEFIKEIKFDRLGAFTYSPEEGTKGYLMPNQIPNDVKQERYEKLMAIQNDISLHNNEAYIGKTIDEVFIVGYDDESFLYEARNYSYAPDDIDGLIYVAAKDEHKLGDRVRVKILDCDAYTLTGEELLNEED